MYEVVLAGQLAAIKEARPGNRYRALHWAASREMAKGLIDLKVLSGDPEELVADGVVALMFPHGVGHLLGMDVHDMEDLGDRAGYPKGRKRLPDLGMRYLRLDRDLLPGMAVTVEPGIYVVPQILGYAELMERAKGRFDVARLQKDFADVRGIRIEDDILISPTAETGNENLTAAVPKTVAEVEAAVQTPLTDAEAAARAYAA